MDSWIHRSNRYYLHQPNIHLEDLHIHAPTQTSSSSSSLHMDVVLARRIRHEFHEQSSQLGGATTLLDTFEDRHKPAQVACFDSSLFAEDQNTSYQVLSRMLVRLNIPEQQHPWMIAQVTQLGRDSVANASHNNKVLPLFAEIVVVEEYVTRRSERDLIDMAIRESTVESERRLHGMVPARKSAIFKALKIERIGDDGGDLREEDDHHDDECRRKRRRGVEHESESCTICMEDLPAGAYVARMPCSHRFHGQCIVKWLKTSHCCPVCRFELPTN